MEVIKNHLKVKSTTGKGGGKYGGDVAKLLQTLMGMVGGKGGKGGGGSGQQKTFKIDKSGGELGEHIGTINSFTEKNNYGFIFCPEVTAAGYGDVFLHGGMKKDYQVGQTVKFDCILNKDSKPVAINLRSVLNDKSGGELGEQIGTIKSFTERTNYGFIDCPNLAAAGYGDVFLHGDMKKGFQAGQIVKFDCILNKDSKPVAINLRSVLKASTQLSIVRNDWQPKTFGIDNSADDDDAGDASSSSSAGELLQALMGMVGGKGGKGGGGSGQQKTFKIDQSGGELGEHIGMINSFTEKTNYGFIFCPEVTAAGYGDVFLHGDMKTGYQVGQTVKFDCILNKDGKPVAINLRSVLNDKSGGELGEKIGMIKSFAERTNYGFIDCPELTAAGYGDVFLHGDMKKGYQVGQTVKFDCILNKDGKPVAINLKSGLK